MKKEDVINAIKKLGKKNLLLIAGLLGILLIGLSAIITPSSDTQAVAGISSGEDSQAYARQLEEQLEGMLASIHGVGACDVMVTMEQGTEYIYATQEKTTQDSSTTSEESRVTEGERVADEETYIMVSTDGGEQPVLLTSLAPKVKGVVVVCAGGDDIGVATNVRGAVSTALHISAENIYVVAGTIS